MTSFDLRRHLEELRQGNQSVEGLLQVLRDFPYQDLDFAKIDHHRPLRTGFPEVVLGQGKTPEQVARIVASLQGRGHPVLVTKTDEAGYRAVTRQIPEAEFNELARVIVVPGSQPLPLQPGLQIVSAGTA
ncbi:MAG: 1-(5-phosphoribosyl)-5-amino-4-imidazole-carboxylate carboxylase, partial [Dehalococcoidia bacterium]